jgi:hypothetical protein
MLKLFRFLKPYRIQIALVFVQSLANLYLLGDERGGARFTAQRIG